MRGNDDACAVAQFDALQASAWKNGLLIINGQSLEFVIGELNRYIPGKIMIADPRIRQRVISGVFNLNDPQSILGSLEKNLGIKTLNLSAVELLYQP